MTDKNEHLEALTEIRSMMERSSRFISLSGLSGVFAGIFALVGAVAGYIYIYFSLAFTSYPTIGYEYYEYATQTDGSSNIDFYTFFFLDAGLVLIGSLSAGIFFTIRKAKKKGQSIWDNTAKRLLINLLIPLATGGIFALLLLNYGLVGLIAPVTLIFYGLALLNASKYTLNDIRYLGISEIILGLLSTYYLGYGLVFWAIGFGVLHIVYGIVMYVKYER